MIIYIGASWSLKSEMAGIAKKFEEHGHRITHKWWEVPAQESYTDEELLKHAANDMIGVVMSQIMVAIASPPSSAGGLFIEQGIAIGTSKPIIAVGKIGEGHEKNIFQLLPHYKWVETVDEAVTQLNQLDLAIQPRVTLA